MKKSFLGWCTALVLVMPYGLQAESWCDIECAEENHELALLSQEVYEDTKVVGVWKRIADYKKDTLGYTHGLHMSVYENSENNKVAIVVEGTDAKDMEDIITDVVQLTASPIVPREYTQAREFVEELREDNATLKTAILAGHSLGGGIAQYVGCSFGMEAHTFNPAGLSDATIEDAQEYFEENGETEPQEILNLISNNNDGQRDIVSKFGTLLGEQKFVFVDKDNILDLHSIKYMHEGLVNLLAE
jgi:predicted esterase YcpF (UPF0227 family)